MTNLRTILEEFEIQRGWEARNISHPQKALKEAIAKIEGMIPEKRENPYDMLDPEVESIPEFNHRRGYNQAIEDMKANMGGKDGL